MTGHEKFHIDARARWSYDPADDGPEVEIILTASIRDVYDPEAYL